MSIDTTKGIAGLKGALHYVRAYRDQVFVVKLGGEVLSDETVRDQVAAQLALLSSLSIRLVVVHGGGPQATALSRRLGQEPRLVAGRRVTDDGALEIAKMVYAGQLDPHGGVVADDVEAEAAGRLLHELRDRALVPAHRRDRDQIPEQGDLSLQDQPRGTWPSLSAPRSSSRSRRW